MNTGPSSPTPGHDGEQIAAAAERRWAFIVAGIIALLIAMMIVTGLHWVSMPPSRVETIDVRRLHLDGEFVESNLGTAVAPDGKIVVRLVAQQYSFTPPCIVVPADTPVTFRATSTDAIHGFIVGTTNANTMLIPGFVATFTTVFHETGETLMPCHEYCGSGHEAMWAKVQIVPAAQFLQLVRASERLTCVPR